MLPALLLLAVAIGSALVANCLTLLFRPALIGRGGERAVRLALARLGLPALHDVVLADALGHTQIDHLVRTTQGIVVIETKTFSGWISRQVDGTEHTLPHGPQMRQCAIPPRCRNRLVEQTSN